MTSVFDLYGYGSPQYGGDSIDASTADVAALYDQQQRYGNSLFGRIDNFLRSKQSQPNQLAADASLWDQAVEAGNRLAHMPVDMLLAGSRTANNWAGSPQFPERVETGDMLAPLGLGAMAGLGAMIPRAALRDRAQAIPAARTPQDVTIVEPVSASQRFRPGDTWEMRSPQWPTSWFEEYHGDGSLPTKIPRSQWDEKTIERAKLFVRDQIARDKANEITDELMWDGRNKVRERWEAEAMAIQDPSKRQILDDAYSARQNWYEHDNPKFMEDPLDWLSYPLPPGTNPVAKIDEMFAVGGKPPDRPPLRDISSALDAPNRMMPDTIPASYFDDIMPAAGAGRAATDLTVPQNRLVRAANDGDDGPLRGSYPSPGNLPLRPSEASSVSLTEAYERYAEKAFQRGLQPDSFERFREAVLDAGIVPQRLAGRSVLPGVELFADQSRASLPGLVVGAVDEPRGITAYHGSPHDFDRFSMDKIGTGEGAQAYGHGLYFAENEGVANAYKKQLTDRTNFVRPDGSLWSADELEHMNVRATAYRGDIDGAIAKARDLAGDDSPVAGHAQRDLEKLLALQASGGVKPNPGRMYEVRINANPDDFLDWDKPLSQQSEKAQPIVRDMAKNKENLDGYINDPVGEYLYGFEDKAPLTAKLREAGIPGIRYLDQGSRTAGDGSRNYVVFDDALVEILRKYGLLGMIGGGSLLGSSESEASPAGGLFGVP